MAVNTIIGPPIILDGLSVYYDFSNTKSYPGSGNIVYDISGNGINATLSGSGASRPTFTSSLGKSNITFTSANQHFMYYTLPTWGTSFTNISIYASPTILWDNIGDIGGARWGWEGTTVNDTNGFLHEATKTPEFLNQSGSIFFTEYKLAGSPSNFGYTTDGIAIPPPSSPLTNPHLYFHGYDHSTGNVLYGYDSIRNETVGSPLNGRGTRTNTRVYFATVDERYGTTSRFTSLKLYAHLLYNRKLSIAEIRTTYDSLQPRFNF